MGGGDNTITPTADQIAQQQVNAKLWNYYEQYYHPLIQAYSAEVTAPTNQKAEAGQVAGQINAEVMKALPSRGSDNPVKNSAQIGQLGQAATSAQQSGQAAVSKKQVGDVQNIIDIGRGQATQSSQDLGSLAQQSLQQEIFNKQLSMQSQAGWQNAIGSTIGMGAAGYMTGRQLSMDNSPITYGVPTTNVSPYSGPLF